MDFEKKFKEVKNVKDFKEVAELCETGLRKEKIKTLSRILGDVDEDSKEYEDILAQIRELQK